jgi:exopolysaccharide biosynthesis predicted pyruvyltransferase EpsI
MPDAKVNGMSPLDLFMSLRGTEIVYIANPGNAGDGFISFATMELLHAHGVKFLSRGIDYQGENKIILFGGGGNLIEGRYLSMATAVRRNAQLNECYVLPQSSFGFSDLCRFTEANLTIFCREPISYRGVLAAGGNPERVHLAHDMTFYLSCFGDRITQDPARKPSILFALRTDGEATDDVIPLENKDLSLTLEGADWGNRKVAFHSSMLVASQIQQFDVVVTDRLHIAIMSAFLGKKVLLGPNA